MRVFTVCAVIFLFCGIVNAGINDGLVAYYPFNGNANDESGNGNNGAVNGATLTMDRFGNVNSAYNFDGNNDDFIKVTTGGFPAGITPVSYSLWLKPKHNDFDKRLLEYGGYVDGANFNLYINSDVYRVDYWGAQYDNFSPVKINEWQHVVLSHDGTSHNFYLNGILTSSNRHNINIINSGNAYIGHHISGNGFGYSGVIDDIRIYKRALSASEVQQLYQEQGACQSGLATKPYTFTAGTPAKATEVNANFDTIYTQNNNLNCQIQVLRSIVCQDHPTASVCQ